MIVWLLLSLLQPPTKPALPLASMVEWTGKETWPEALQKLNQTGNVVVEGSAARGQQVTVPTLKLPRGKQTFWAALDEVCNQAQLQMIQGAGRIELVAAEGPRTNWIAYDGPWHARIVRRSVIGYDDPKLDRLICHVELSLEPRLQPLLFTMRSSGIPSGTYSFDGEQAKMIEVRLPAPPRNVQHLEQLTIEGDAWVAVSRLQFTMPIKVAVSQTVDGAIASIKEIEVNRTKTWTIDTELRYPPGSLEWESHQARLLGSMKLSLRRGKEVIENVGREIRTDAGRTVSATWYFTKVTGQSGEWEAVLSAPSSPVLMPMKLVFTKVALP